MIKVSLPDISSKEVNEVKNILYSNWIVEGPKTKILEDKFKKRFKKKFCIFFNSWTTAAFALFKVLNIKEGSEIILPSLSFIATANAPLLSGYKLKFVDVDIDTYNISTKDIEKKISKKTKMILSVDQLGNPCNQKEISKICKKKRILNILDSACSFGSKHENKEIGHYSDFMIFSFHARKLITSGEGGAILFNDDKILKKLLLFKSHGMDKEPYKRSKSSPLQFEKYPSSGLNLRFTDIQAGILNSQFDRSKNIIKKRIIISKKYDNFFSKYPDLFCIQKETLNSKTNRQAYMIVFKKNNLRNSLIEFLYKNKIETRRAIPSIHKQIAYSKNFNIKLPNTEFISKNGIVLPLYSQLNQKNLNYITDKIKKFLVINNLDTY
ncbi:DegT/DnrJ/EryC1/StrS aminotransferase family protein [Candidatus Pelagibacter sp.]|jgi:perosamine synthetase|nr:DegT/DnrJ/EryC1/StrS aminotransferase family protein [Candidatus Pelagibacter sp.]